MQFALYITYMSSQNSQKIDILKLFSKENIQNLYNEYVVPFKDNPEIQHPIQPRRMIGRYLTYLDDSSPKNISVMINLRSNEPTVNCDCKEYAQYKKCYHVARVIHSLNEDFNTAINKAENISETKNKKTILTLPDKESKIKIKYTNSNEKKTASANTTSGVFKIENAAKFTYFDLRYLFKETNQIQLSNKKIKYTKKYENGFSVLNNTSGINHTVTFMVDKRDDLLVSCDCGKTTETALCPHAFETTYVLVNYKGENLFAPYLNRIHEKNELLAEYGLTVDDPESEAFVFKTTVDNRITITKIPRNIGSVSDIISFTKSLDSNTLYNPSKYIQNVHGIGWFLHLNVDIESNFPIKMNAYSIENEGIKTEKYLKLNIDADDNLNKLSVLPQEEFDILMDFSFLKYKYHLQNAISNYTYNYLSSYSTPIFKRAYTHYFFQKLEQHWSFYCNQGPMQILDGKTFSKSNLISVDLYPDAIHADIVVEYTPRFIYLKTRFKDNEDQVILHQNDDKRIISGRMVYQKETLYLIKDSPLTELIKSMPEGILSFPAKLENKILTEILFPLSQKFGIELPDNLSVKYHEYPFTPVVYLKEFQNNSLIVQPYFYYGDHKFDLLDQRNYVVENDNQKYYIKRNRTEEKAFIEFIQSAHSHFRNQNFMHYYTLPFDLVMKNAWFIEFTRNLMNLGIKIMGFNELKKFRYNTSDPTWDMKISSGIDWFDVKVKVQWGDQEISLRDIKKAILNNQDFVVLDDGSIGVLPREWINKYLKLFKFGTEENDNLKIYKKQFNIVELLFDQIDDQQIVNEINEKKQKLLHLNNIETKPVPDSIQAELRPYQETGYQWMQVLDEISWGGCLADDMGLGKTLQTITFLTYIKDKYDHPTSLIVCPTSLIFNWENELKKFAPSLTYMIFYGSDRAMEISDFSEYDIIITSYGVVRSDIERLSKFNWEYVILDESQAIKNPQALSTKAVQLLNTRNKFILSGTPLQNNTYDIYAQFNFLNPGLLGNKDFFKQEFANPIDKNADADAGQMLRNLIKPFMLRRTKAEVAVDLPEKTETILWCQMEDRQKQLYDEYKEFYRQSIMEKIDNQGMAKSGIYILEGLLRLRQICDDPRLVKDAEHQTHIGIKIKELMREIDENTGDHKMLIFSQFTEMLALIRSEFDKNNVPYCYLDGSTSAQERNNQVEIFQNNKEIKIFLISLKAGGVGLNLTEADYVYLVDPWWNPAVEQQAIDRTHRIGQKNKIFAYKMICKDTVEEKIIKLQEKKLNLSKEIIQEDKAFFKSLNKEDIQFLFS